MNPAPEHAVTVTFPGVKYPRINCSWLDERKIDNRLKKVFELLQAEKQEFWRENIRVVENIRNKVFNWQQGSVLIMKSGAMRWIYS